MRRAFIALSVVVTISVIAPFEWARRSSARQVYDTPEAMAPAPVALVLGAGLLPDGRPTPMLSDRVAAAVDLYRRGTVHHLLMSGDNSRADYDEPTSMRRQAIDAGVPASAITLDFAGFSTLDSCARARRIFGVRDAIVVTQDFHITRAVATCRSRGVDARGLRLSSDGYSRADVDPLRLREAAATMKAFGDVVRRAEPRFGGDFVGLPGSESLPAVNAAWDAALR